MFRDNEIILIGGVIDDISTNVGKTFVTSISYDYEINWLYRYHRRESDNAIFNIFEKNGFYYLQGIVMQDTPSNTVDEWFLVVDSMGCDDAVCTVGVEEMLQFDNDDNLIIFPNPAKDNINISVNDAHKTNSTYQLQISDITGKTVLSKTISQTTNIDVSMLPNGVYILTLGSKTHKMKTEKLIIQR